MSTHHQDSKTVYQSISCFGFQAYFYLSACLLIFSSILFYRSHHEAWQTNLSVWLCLIGFGVTFIRPNIGLMLLLFLLPLSPNLHLQITHLTGLQVTAYHHPGLDIALGFVLGALVRNLASRKLMQPPADWQLIGVACVAHFYISLSVVLAIARNCWQSASSTTMKGILWNLQSIRLLDRHTDFFPLKDLYSYTIAFTVFVFACAILRKSLAPIRTILIPFVGSTIVVTLFAILQKMFHIGWDRDQFYRGVNSFFPDIHSFGGFATIGVLGLFACYQTCSKSGRIWVYIAHASSYVSAILSASRFTIVLVIFSTLAVAFGKLRRRLSSLQLFIAVFATGLAMMLMGYMVFTYGFLKIKPETFQHILVDPSFSRFNAILSMRPEVYKAGLEMWSQFPLVGLGQGVFNRSSSIPVFSSSQYFLKLSGENAHNYFIQTLAELGLVGFGLLGLVFIYPLCWGKDWQQSRVSRYMIGGLFLGNIFAHSLLVREFLVILAIFTALLYVQSFDHSPSLVRIFVDRFRKKWGLLVSLILAGHFVYAAGTEVVNSFGKLPFIYGSKCYRPMERFSDGWVGGNYSTAIPAGTKSIHVDFHAGHYDIDKRELLVAFSVKADSEHVLSAKVVTVRDTSIRSLDIDLPDQIHGDLVLGIKSSRCFIPFNVGVEKDSRHLGVNLIGLNFDTKSK